MDGCFPVKWGVCTGSADGFSPLTGFDVLHVLRVLHVLQTRSCEVRRIDLTLLFDF